MRPLSDRQKRLAYNWLVDGPLRPLARPLYKAVLKAELALHGAMSHPQSENRSSIVGTTAIVKTFERPAHCRALIDSIRRQYRELPIIVVDDSRDPHQFEGTTSLSMPYDSGVSAGRRLALQQVKTQFVLNLDDDFVFCGRTDIAAALALMNAYPQIDIMGGRVVDLPLYISHDFRSANLFPHDTLSVWPVAETIGGLEVHDKVANFFLARTDRLRLVDWDDRLKRLDHADFFTRAKGVLLTVYNPGLQILHVRDPFATEYRQKRYDLDADLAYLDEKYRTPWTGAATKDSPSQE